MIIPKVRNMTGNSGKEVANQFIISMPDGSVVFQSYASIIAVIDHGKITLDINYWDYSQTTGKYRSIFLGEFKEETQRKIDSGEYVLEDLN